MSVGLWLALAGLIVVYHLARWLVRLVVLLVLSAVVRRALKGGMRNG